MNTSGLPFLAQIFVAFLWMSLVSNLPAANVRPPSLEALAKQYTDSCQQVPQSITVLLSTARREKAKQDAKKMANRRSAYSSRDRKKLKHNAIARGELTEVALFLNECI